MGYWCVWKDIEKARYLYENHDGDQGGQEELSE